MRRRCRANIPRRGCSSGWDRMRIWSPIRSRRARQINVVAIVPGTWNRPGWSAPGDANEIKNAFASPRWPATARMLIGAVDEWRQMGAVHGARHRRMERRRDRAARRRRACDAAVRRAGRRNGDRGCRGAGQMPWRKRRRKCRGHPGGAEALCPAAARRACCGCSAPRGNRGASITSPDRWRSRATSRSRRWARTACWRGRTGSTTGGP